MKLIPLPALTDNYIWMLHDGQQALVVDPGEAQPVLDALGRWQLQLDAILVTHHHPDHTAGVSALRQASGARVFGPAREAVPQPLTGVQMGDRVASLGLQFEVIEVPGHTAGHVAYYGAEVDPAPLLFCGDTLFSAGCGRLFEGTAAQMLASLKKLAALPDATRICCAHEYTLNNLKFAVAVDTDNLVLKACLAGAELARSRQQPTLPSTLALERQINPFLRTDQHTIVSAVQRFDASVSDQLSVFAALRQWKNEFR